MPTSQKMGPLKQVDCLITQKKALPGKQAELVSHRRGLQFVDIDNATTVTFPQRNQQLQVGVVGNCFG